MITLETLQQFIETQPDDRKVNLYEGRPTDPLGCVLVHYGTDHNIPFEQVVFDGVGDERVAGDAQQFLIDLALHPGDNNETYGSVKLRIPKALEAAARFRQKYNSN